MVNLVIKNLKEVEENLQGEVKNLCDEKAKFFEELLKKYEKDLTLEVIFDHSSAVYKVSVSLDLKSKKLLIAEEDSDVVKAVTALFASFKKVVKKQYELERKDYEYKRKR
jgi:ribosome-associated translation inhibitor RaiA